MAARQIERAITTTTVSTIVSKTDPSAEVPYKSCSTAVGYDLTLVSRTENRVDDLGGKINGFSTGLRMTPPPGYYLEIVATPNLAKTGYMLANGAMVLDPENDDELILPLYKFDDSAADLELPFRAAVVIIKKQYGSIMALSGGVRTENSSYYTVQPPQARAVSKQADNDPPPRGRGPKGNHIF